MKDISVILPSYNRGNLIKRAINSILGQTYPVKEIIVIDDHSSDNTEQTVRQLQCHDPRIIYHKNPSNMGAAASRNTGVSLSSSQLIAFQDSDDRWRPDKLELQMDHWQKHPEYQMIYCAYLLHRTDGSVCKVPYADTVGDLDGNIRNTLLLNNTIGTPAILMKKDAFLSVNGFDTSIAALEDWDMVLRFSRQYQIGYVDSILMDAYLQSDGISSQLGAFYDCRCRMIARNKHDLLDAELFDTAVSQLFRHAGKYGLLDTVKQLLSLYLTSA